MVIFHLIHFRMIFILLIFSLIADQVSGQVALIPKLDQGRDPRTETLFFITVHGSLDQGDLGKGWTIGRHREQRNTFSKKVSLSVIVTRARRL